METGLPLWHLAVLALIQGITEFLPISSSAHLILVPEFLGWKDQGLLLDVAMHIGSLAAVMIFFRKDTARLAIGALHAAAGRDSDEARMAGLLALATVPVMVAGLLLKSSIAHEWRSPALIAATTSLFAVVLWVSDRKAGEAFGKVNSLTWRQALIIGLAQMLALVPGVSRSGITMSAALFLGLVRPEAARFSLLLSIPTTAAAGVLAVADLVETGNPSLQWSAVLAGTLAFLSALAAIAALMAWVRRSTFLPFVFYRLCLSLMIVWWFWPELGWYFGYPLALLLMAAVAGGLLWYFWRNDWLGRRGGSQ